MGRYYKYKYIYFRDEVEYESMWELVKASNISHTTIRRYIKMAIPYKGHTYNSKLKILEEIIYAPNTYYTCSNGKTYSSIYQIRIRLPMTKHYRPYEEGIELACLTGQSYYGYRWKKEKVTRGFKYVLTK